MTPAGLNGGGSVRISAGCLSDPAQGVRRTGETRAAGGRWDKAGTRRNGMTQYLISFDDGAMTFPREDLPDVAKAAQEVVREATDAGVWVFGGGLESQRASIVATDGMVTDGPYPETKAVIGGFAMVAVPSSEDTLAWAAK